MYRVDVEGYQILESNRQSKCQMCVAYNCTCSACSVPTPHVCLCGWLCSVCLSQEVLEHTQMSGDMFTLYLHQNYLDFFTDMDDIVSCSLTVTHVH